MSGQSGGFGPPAPPEYRTFIIYWASDKEASQFYNVTASRRDGNILMLGRASSEWLINLDQVTSVCILDEVSDG